MAKKPTAAATETKAETKGAPENKSTGPEPKYTVDDLVEATSLQPASVRVALRELGVEKNFGNKYGWANQKDFNEIVKAMKERSAKRITAAAPAEEKPAPKAAAAKAAPAGAFAAKGGKAKAA